MLDNKISIDLIKASNENKIDHVKNILNNEIDINFQTEREGFTSLMLASRRGNKEIVELLLNSGADSNTIEKNGKTALIFATYYGYIDIVKLLISNGANINHSSNDLTTPLIASCAAGHKDVVKFLLNNGADINFTDKKGRTALLWAIQKKHIDIIKLYLKEAIDINVIYKYGTTALHNAIMTEDIEVVKLLISYGANLDVENKNGYTALMIAVKLDNKEIVELLLNSGADSNIVEKNGHTALIFGAHKGYIDIVKLLISSGANINHSSNDLTTPLIASCAAGHKDVVEFLLNNGADINFTRKSGRTAFSYAIKKKDIDIITLLLKEAIDVNAIYKCGGTALHDAISTEDIEVVKLLLRHGASVNLSSDFLSPLQCAIFADNKDLVELLISQNANINQRYIFGMTALMSGVVVGNEKIVSLLLDNHADVNIIDDFGATALMVACDTKSTLEVRKKRLGTYLDMDLDSKVAILNFIEDVEFKVNIEIIELLINNGANIDVENESGYTAVMYAIEGKYNQAIRLLKKAGASIKKNADIIQNPIEVILDSKKNYIFKNQELINEIFKVDSKSLKNGDVNLFKDDITKGVNLSLISPIELIKQNRYSLEYIKIFIENVKSNINDIDDDGNTALIIASKLQNEALVKLLLENNANTHIQNKKEKSAFDYALEKDNDNIMDLIIFAEENENIYFNSINKPKDLVRLLTNFRKDTPIKYTTHNWDMIFKDDYGDFQGYISSVTNQWNYIEQELKELSPRLHTKLYNFLLNTDINSKNWCSKKGDDISIGWSSLKGLEEWCNNDNDPFKFKLEKTYKIEDKTITTFGEVINLFKQEIQIRTEKNILENIFIDIEEQLDVEFDGIFEIDLIKLKGKSFYTDVEIFKNVITRIFSEIKKRPEFNKIRVEVVEDKESKYYDLKIMQIGSQSGKSSKEMLEIIRGGDSSIIKESLTNLCDWSCESSYEDEYYRINYLKSDNIKDFKILEHVPKGFTHIMRFYK